MKILLSWLNEYGDFADPTDAAAVQRLADTMTSLGLAVEEIRPGGATVAGVVSAQVKRLEQHADAAKVQRVWVDAGDGAERHVWCGAFNMQVGDVVPLATLGTTMPDGRLIERRGILGIDSEGMLCRERRARARRRPQRHPDPAAGFAARRAVRRGARHPSRRLVRPRPHPQPPGLLGLRRRRTRCRRTARRRAPPPCTARGVRGRAARSLRSS